MPDDIEDFLKRAAQRRQAKSAGPSTPAQPSVNQAPVKPLAAPRPEYTSARTERIPRNRPDQEPLQAILVDDDNHTGEGVAKHLETVKKQRSKAAKAAEAKRAGGTVKPLPPPPSTTAGSYVPPERAPNVPSQTITSDGQGSSATDRLIAMLRQPEGMMQAVLLQEILKRPEHRW